MATGNSSVGYTTSASVIYNSLAGQTDAGSPSQLIMVTNLDGTASVSVQATDANGANCSGLVTIGPGSTQAVVVRTTGNRAKLTATGTGSGNLAWWIV